MISIHNIAVLRAAVEGKDLGYYFSSFGALVHWQESTAQLGWIEHKTATPLGQAVYAACKLDQQPGFQRAYMWPDSQRLVDAATKWMEQHKFP